MKYFILSALFLLCVSASAQNIHGKSARGVVYDSLHPGRIVMTDTLDFTNVMVRTDNALMNVYINGASIDVVCDTVETWKRVTGWTQNIDGGWDADTTKGEFTVPYSGLYRISAHLSFSANAANRTMHAAAYHNETKLVTCAFERTISTAAQVGNGSFSGVAYLTSAAKVTLRVEVELGTATFTVNHAQFTMEYIR